MLPIAIAALSFVCSTPARAATSATTTTTSSTSTTGTVVEFKRVADQANAAHLNEAEAELRVRRDPKARDWLDRYPPARLTWQATYESDEQRWLVRVWDKKAGQILEAKVNDLAGDVGDVWTGPQVAWSMARGRDGAFGGKEMNSLAVWALFCGFFLLGLGNWRKPLCWRNLDLVVLLSFAASLWFFNRGAIFTSVPLVYPPLLYLLARVSWIGWRGRLEPVHKPVIPTMVLAAAAIFLVGFRVGLNLHSSNVIDVGYAGVIGADRILGGEAPWGHFPASVQRETVQLPECGHVVDQNGTPVYRLQTNGKCEQPNSQGDTYGPVAYLSYVPGVLLFGWSGFWDDLPAAHFTAIVVDLLCALGLALIGLRFGDRRLAVTFAFAWLAYPFTQYVSNSNTNDALPPLFLIWGFWLINHTSARGVSVALSTWTKFTSVIVAPLWAAYPNGLGDRRRVLRFLATFGLTTWIVFLVLLLEPKLLDAVQTFWNRTFSWQISRRSPFSLWDWGQYHARGIPDLHLVQRALQALVLIAAVALAFFPRRSPLRLAAFTAALILGSELVLTHWFYLYIPWFYPFVVIALLGTSHALAKEVEPPEPALA